MNVRLLWKLGTALSFNSLRPNDQGPRIDEQIVNAELQIVTANEQLNIVPPQLCVIIPTRNEADNVEPLLGRLVAALAGIPAEIIFVDDSDDDTPERVLDEGRGLDLPVRLIRREPGQRSGGLSTAVVSGMQAARAPWVLVMDADLQHPPEVVTQLFAPARRQPVDLVVASRYAGHGSSTGLDGGTRRGSSRLATRID